jgi:ribosomal protein S18 acetylase RimI-like enzyme
LIEIERITPQTALVFRDVRLRALLDSPTAFSSTYAKESALPDEEWMKRSVRWSSEGAAMLLAFEGDVACGIIGSYQEEDPKRAQIISMWVDPAFRRAGVGKALIDAIVNWAWSRGVLELKLMVTSANPGAIAFYERMGFKMTGETAVYPNDSTITEYEMVRAADQKI